MDEQTKKEMEIINNHQGKMSEAIENMAIWSKFGIGINASSQNIVFSKDGVMITMSQEIFWIQGAKTVIRMFEELK